MSSDMWRPGTEPPETADEREARLEHLARIRDRPPRERCSQCGQPLPPSREELDRIMAQAQAERTARRTAREAREAAEAANAAARRARGAA